jgi:hypothetical protein
MSLTLNAPQTVSLDSTGSGLYAECRLREHMRLLRCNAFGNPHRTILYGTVRPFFKHIVTIFLDSDPLVRYCMALSCTFTVFSAMLLFRSAVLYRMVRHHT